MTKFEDKTAVDFVIVGAGGAGGVVAKELSTAGFQVVVLEQGPYLHEGDFIHDELKFKDVFDPPFIGQEVLTNDHTLQPNTFRKTARDKALLTSFAQYGRCVGGGTVHFTGNYWRFHEIDFAELNYWGPVEGTGLADWPITYADLEPYYTKAEWEMGISGLAGANPFDPPRSKPYPLPPLPVKSSGVLLERGARKLGWHPYPAPLAILSQPYQGRSACAHCGFCEFFGCEWGAKSSTLASVIPIAEKTGRCEIRPNSYVRKISTYKRGRVDGVLYFDPKKQEHFQKAKAVVVCANGAETPRLLLMSKSNLFPRGLANSSGMVGKFFMLNLGSDRSLELLDAAGALKKWAYPVEDAAVAGHLMGTCRMGNDPKSSVVDKHHRAHDVPNLFMVDGSSFVTSGRNQPTCTIQALAYRAADHIVRMAKTGDIPK